MQDEQLEPSLDRFIFFAGGGLLISVVVPIILFPEDSARVINQIFTYLTTELGILYILAAIGTLTVLMIIGIGPLGRTKLGQDPPPYSRFSWIAM